MKLIKKIYQTTSQSRPIVLLIKIILLAGLLVLIPGESLAAPADQVKEFDLVVIGQLSDAQNQPVVDAIVQAVIPGEAEPIAETESLEDGSWILTFSEIPSQALELIIEHPHFQPQVEILDRAEEQELVEAGV